MMLRHHGSYQYIAQHGINNNWQDEDVIGLYMNAASCVKCLSYVTNRGFSGQNIKLFQCQNRFAKGARKNPCGIPQPFKNKTILCHFSILCVIHSTLCTKLNADSTLQTSITRYIIKRNVYALQRGAKRNTCRFQNFYMTNFTYHKPYHINTF